MSCVLVAVNIFAFCTVTELFKQWIGYLWVHKLKMVIFLKAEFPNASNLFIHVLSWLWKVSLAFNFLLSWFRYLNQCWDPERLMYITYIVAVTVIYSLSSLLLIVNSAFKRYLVYFAELLAARNNGRHLTLHNYWNTSQRISNHWLLEIQKIQVQEPLHKSITFARTQVSLIDAVIVNVLWNMLNYSNKICCVLLI